MYIFANLKRLRKKIRLKTGQFVIFITIVLVIYGAVNTYIYLRGYQALPSHGNYRIWFTICFWVIASSFVLARFLNQAYPCLFSGIITWIGSFWLAFMLYFFIFILILDILRLLTHFIHFFPLFIYLNYPKTKLIFFCISLILVSLVVVSGFINARNVKIKELSISIPKRVDSDHALRMVMVSDVHMGNLIARRKTAKLVRKINELKPDIVVFAGDIVDEDLAPVIKNNLGEALTGIKARLGVYAIPGNHEYIGGAEPAIEYLKEHGIIVLRDTSVFVDNSFYLVGRDDRDKYRFTGKKRKELKELLTDIDKSLPIILLDHQPFNLRESAALGVDLQLSGHTHHGQLWPFNYITKAMYEVSWGELKINETQFYVSNGFGTWGPPVRLGNRPEIVLINLSFN